MVDYQNLYITLFNQVSEAIDTLKNAQAETLDNFINSDPPKEDIIAVIDKLKFSYSSAFKLK